MIETYISCSAEDGSEKMLCLKAGLQLQQRATNGSPFVVVAEFTASSWDEASQKHYDLNGWGRYTPVDEVRRSILDLHRPVAAATGGKRT